MLLGCEQIFPQFSGIVKAAADGNSSSHYGRLLIFVAHFVGHFVELF